MPDEHHDRTDATTPPGSVGTKSPMPGRESDESVGAVPKEDAAPRPKAPLITAFEVENFKGIGRLVRIDLRPITLLFGSNSAGKSTILHALCYAHEILSHRNVDAGETELGGDQIDLGGFRSFVHGHDLDRAVRLRFELDLRGRDLPELAGWYFSSAWQFDEPRLVGESAWVELVAEWKEGAATVGSYAVGIDGTIVGCISAGDGIVARLVANLSHPLLESEQRDVTNAAAAKIGQVGEASTSEPYGGQFQRMDVLLGSALPIFDRHLEITVDDVESLDDDTFEHYQRLRFRMSTVLVGVGRLLQQEVATLRYVGPLRHVQPRNDSARASRGPLADEFVQELFYETVPPPRPWANGAAAWDLLNESAQGDARIVSDTSRWLSRADRLDTGYELRVRSVVELPGDEPLVAGILDSKQPKKAGPGSNQPELEANQSPGDILRAADPSLVDALADRIRHGARKRLELVSRRIDRPVRMFDVGVGISQLLPVVVAALDLNRPTITAIEQPELHVHPRLQVELGDLFAQQAVNGGVLLIETHSEHLLLRIMRRMRQTNDDTLPDGAPRLQPEDVAVFFVEPDGAETLVREMPLNERGELVKAWPGGFFEEDLREIF